MLHGGLPIALQAIPWRPKGVDPADSVSGGQVMVIPLLLQPVLSIDIVKTPEMTQKHISIYASCCHHE